MIKAYIKTDRHGSMCEAGIGIPEENLKGMSDEEKDAYVTAIVKETVEGMSEWGWVETDIHGNEIERHSDF